MITSRRLTVDDVRGQKPSGTPEPHGSDVGTDEGEGARVSGTARSTPQQQAFPAIIAAISLWLLTIVIRLDSAAHDAAAVGSTS